MSGYLMPPALGLSSRKNALARAILSVLAIGLFVTGCATVNVVEDKARRFDQAAAAYDAGDYASAYVIWNQLAAENDLAAMRNAAHLLRKGLGVERNPGRALDLYTEAARKGLVLAMANVAEMHLNGEGTLKDPEEAARWYAMAANGGLSLAMMRLGELYEQGLGVKQDKAKAQEWYARAARNGYQPALAKVVGAAAHGGGARRVEAVETPQGHVPPAETPAASDPFRGQRRIQSQPVVDDADRAAQGSRTAEQPQQPPGPPAGSSDPAALAMPAIEESVLASLPPADAQRLQAGMAAYSAGQMTDAFKLWRALAGKGVADAQFRIGLMFEAGKGVGQDKIEAYRWYKQSAAKSPNGAQGVARVAARMTTAERAIAESMASPPPQPAPKPAASAAH
jgi:hypothetical protein